ncbi:IclR family transcriptional regulator [Antrihabitans cavernicola]|uniref:Helix-turn-helix domain-containing protein n=1 Tax=Antrihabitans cavernicola TaxID=2495913 RepID=A0A5A7S4F9_9NOCA|nr:helix-turn-helix domain-containing protein [Spelaeibacter cavernicola]KAA0018095.1 helix-turn-helix domain-containing protein [Spelaeibacter cavernicola]
MSSVNGRRSPPTERVIQVLDFLVARKDRRFGLSELARQLDISKPTCLGIVTALAEAGYLTRDAESKTYGLGPALIAAGRAAQEGYAVGAIARRHLAAVSARFHTTCSASAVVGDQVVVLDITAPEGVRATAKVGQVYPFAPPVGLMYVLWGGDDELESWLRREPTLPVRYDRERLRRVVAQCRSTGYLVETLTPIGRRLQSAMAGVAAHELPPELRAVLGEMVSSLGERIQLDGDDDSDEHRVSLVAAPTYDGDGNQAMVVTLHIGAAIGRAEIAERGAALVAAADAITAEIGGRARAVGQR